MNSKLKLYQELAYVVNKDIKVVYSDEDRGDINNNIIEVKRDNDIRDFEDELQPYLLIDLGFNYTNYCSKELFNFIHELGHLVNGWINPLEYYAFEDLYELNEVNHSIYKIIHDYLLLDDEWYANEWAIDFIKSNKKYIKRLEVELCKAQLA